MKENKYDPIKPEYVLFGLIFVNFLPWNILPHIKPPISVAMQIDNKYKNSNLFLESKIIKRYN